MSVSRYFCLLLVGLSGMVISSHPPCNRGFRTWFLNLVRSFLLTDAINVPIAFCVRQLRRIWTWCRLSADLSPASSSDSVTGRLKVVVTHESDTSITGSATPLREQQVPGDRCFRTGNFQLKFLYVTGVVVGPISPQFRVHVDLDFV